jgi:hypothetical protein
MIQSVVGLCSWQVLLLLLVGADRFGAGLMAELLGVIG